MSSSPVEVGSRFIASTMHEVRTPLQTIIGTLELLEDTNLTKEQREYIHQISFSANALLGLANDVLDFTKISSSHFKLEIAPFNLIDLAERVVDLVTVESFTRGLEIVTDIDYNIPRLVSGDAKRVQQILLNLVKNAVKFTEKGFIYVRISLRQNTILFEIIDSGIGVPEDKKELIFSDYYQVDSSSVRKSGGTGLGLSICKNLVEVMKGKIGVLSNPSGGSNFWYTIPLAAESGSEDEFNMEPSKFTVPENTRVLIVDDNVLALKSFRKKLEFYGIRNIICVDSGAKALDAIQKARDEGSPISIVFTDMGMIPMDGWRFASEVRSLECGKDIKLYMLVPEGQLRQDAKMKMLDWFDGYIYKPVKQKMLLEVLCEIFNSENGTEEVNLQPLEVVETEKIAQGLNILVAEDTKVNQLLLEKFLDKFGANVFLADNGQMVMDQVREHPDIDLIFMDIFMPIKSGIDATVELRNNGYKGIIIACTANNDQDDFDMYKQVGMNDIIVKPFKRATIREVLEKWGTVLIVPDAKNIINLSYIENQSSEIWNIDDFMDTTGNNVEFAISLMDEYMEQSKSLMERLKEELKNPQPDIEKVKLYTHTMKGSSASVSAVRFAELGRQMNDAAKAGDLTTLESARINYEIDFISFINIVENWKNTI